MAVQNIFDFINEFVQNDPQSFWITVVVIVVILYFIFKSKNKSQSNGNMDRFNWQVFQRKNR